MGLQLGPWSYLLKDTGRETLLNTIRAAARGGSRVKPAVIQRVYMAKAEGKIQDDSR